MTTTTTPDGFLERKGFLHIIILYTQDSTWYFFSFSLTYRLPTYLQHHCNLPLGARSPPSPQNRRRTNPLHTHTHATQHNTNTPSDMQSCFRTSFHIYIYMYIPAVCYLPVGIVGELVYIFFRLTLASPEECILYTRVLYTYTTLIHIIYTFCGVCSAAAEFIYITVCAHP